MFSSPRPARAAAAVFIEAWASSVVLSLPAVSLTQARSPQRRERVGAAGMRDGGRPEEGGGAEVRCCPPSGMLSQMCPFGAPSSMQVLARATAPPNKNGPNHLAPRRKTWHRSLKMARITSEMLFVVPAGRAGP